MVIAPDSLIVREDVIAHPLTYRAACLQQPFRSVTFGAQTFHGLAEPPTNELTTYVLKAYPWFKPTLTFLRLSPRDQVEPNDWHTDATMGTWTGILYLNPEPPEGDGTIVGNALIAAVFNRLVIFPARQAHCRGLLANYGTTPETARLIQVMFGGPPTWQ